MITYLHFFIFNTRLFRRILHILILVVINGWMLPWSEEPPLMIISAVLRYAITAGANDKDSVIGT